MKNGRLKERDRYAYSMIKDIFAYYNGRVSPFDLQVYEVHLDILSLLWVHNRISDEEYKTYQKNLHRASQRCEDRYFATL